MCGCWLIATREYYRKMLQLPDRRSRRHDFCNKPPAATQQCWHSAQGAGAPALRHPGITISIMQACTPRSQCTIATMQPYRGHCKQPQQHTQRVEGGAAKQAVTITMPHTTRTLQLDTCTGAPSHTRHHLGAGWPCPQQQQQQPHTQYRYVTQTVSMTTPRYRQVPFDVLYMNPQHRLLALHLL